MCCAWCRRWWSRTPKWTRRLRCWRAPLPTPCTERAAAAQSVLAPTISRGQKVDCWACWACVYMLEQAPAYARWDLVRWRQGTTSAPATWRRPGRGVVRARRCARTVAWLIATLTWHQQMALPSGIGYSIGFVPQDIATSACLCYSKTSPRGLRSIRRAASPSSGAPLGIACTSGIVSAHRV